MEDSLFYAILHTIKFFLHLGLGLAILIILMFFINGSVSVINHLTRK